MILSVFLLQVWILLVVISVNVIDASAAGRDTGHSFTPDPLLAIHDTVGKKCANSYGMLGVCKLPWDCKTLKSQLRKKLYPNICGYDPITSIPIICCAYHKPSHLTPRPKGPGEQERYDKYIQEKFHRRKQEDLNFSEEESSHVQKHEEQVKRHEEDDSAEDDSSIDRKDAEQQKRRYEEESSQDEGNVKETERRRRYRPKRSAEEGEPQIKTLSELEQISEFADGSLKLWEELGPPDRSYRRQKRVNEGTDSNLGQESVKSSLVHQISIVPSKEGTNRKHAHYYSENSDYQEIPMQSESENEDMYAIKEREEKLRLDIMSCIDQLRDEFLRRLKNDALPYVSKKGSGNSLPVENIKDLWRTESESNRRVDKNQPFQVSYSGGIICPEYDEKIGEELELEMTRKLIELYRRLPDEESTTLLIPKLPPHPDDDIIMDDSEFREASKLTETRDQSPSIEPMQQEKNHHSNIFNSERTFLGKVRRRRWSEGEYSERQEWRPEERRHPPFDNSGSIKFEETNDEVTINKFQHNGNNDRKEENENDEKDGDWYPGYDERSLGQRRDRHDERREAHTGKSWGLNDESVNIPNADKRRNQDVNTDRPRENLDYQEGRQKSYHSKDDSRSSLPNQNKRENQRDIGEVGAYEEPVVSFVDESSEDNSSREKSSYRGDKKMSQRSGGKDQNQSQAENRFFVPFIPPRQNRPSTFNSNFNGNSFYEPNGFNGGSILNDSDDYMFPKPSQKTTTRRPNPYDSASEYNTPSWNRPDRHDSDSEYPFTTSRTTTRRTDDYDSDSGNRYTTSRTTTRRPDRYDSDSENRRTTPKTTTRRPDYYDYDTDNRRTTSRTTTRSPDWYDSDSDNRRTTSRTTTRRPDRYDSDSNDRRTTSRTTTRRPESYESGSNNHHTTTRRPDRFDSNSEDNSNFPQGDNKPKSSTKRYEGVIYPTTSFRPWGNGNSGITTPNYSEDGHIIYPGEASTTTSPPRYKPKPTKAPVKAPRISELRCAEYKKLTKSSVAALPLTFDPQPQTVQSENCPNNGVSLVVGGEKAVLNEFPHMVAIGFKNRGRVTWNCGGTLISENFVLTAAHCINTSLGSPVQVRLGELNLNDDDDGAHPINIKVKRTMVHPDYKEVQKYYDIALIQMESSVKFNNSIRPACLPQQKDLRQNEIPVATGWGTTDYGGKRSDALLKVGLSVINNTLCNRLYDKERQFSSSLEKGIIDSMLCAGKLEGGKDTCLGDSGGPLQIPHPDSKCQHYVVGITSFGKVCGQENSPGVYTRVSSYLPWIENIVWKGQ